MAPKIFITGGTGYIGGTVLDTLVNQHPEYEITALLRNPPANFSELYPKVKIVRGDYDASEVLSKASSEADIVVHNGNSDHQPSLTAIVEGLLRSSSVEKPKFLLHLSGTGIIADWRDPKYHGRSNPKVWSDIDDIEAITNRPDGELHRHTDKFLQETARVHGDKLKIAIMCPPDIYGKGRGPGKQASVYVPVYWEQIQKLGGRVFYGGEGTNVRSWVHIEDLMKVYLKVVEAAVDGGGKADWGVEGYYFAASQEHSQLETAKAAGKILKKHDLIEDAEPISVSLTEIAQMLIRPSFPDLGTYLFAANSRSKPDRAKARLGYEPDHGGFLESLEEDLLAAAR